MNLLLSYLAPFQTEQTQELSQTISEAVAPMEFLEVPIFDDDIYKLLFRFCVNLVFVSLVVGCCYYAHQKKIRYVFTFLLMNIMIFFICFTLKKLDLGLGIALGLFAIFAIIRYRTDAIDVKEMTYLFIVIGLAVINALSNKKTSLAELAFSNTMIVVLTFLFERMLIQPPKIKLMSQDVVYDKVDLLFPNRVEELHADLESRTGIAVSRVDVKKIDLKSGNATIVIRYEKGDPKQV